MSRIAKVVVLALAGALLLQPLAASAVCRELGSAPQPCPSGCGGAHPATPAVPADVQPAAPACCEISSSEPTPRATLLKGTEAPRPLAAAPGTPAVTRHDAPLMPVAVAATPPRVASSSLQSLFCVFLI